MKYMMLICHAPDFEPTDEILAETMAWVGEMDARGVRERGERLRPAVDATTVRVREGETVVTAGPFAELAEQVLGFDLIDCADLDEALEVAAKHPAARLGSVEVRPLWPLP